MLCKILIINMLDYKFKRFIFNKTITFLFLTIKEKYLCGMCIICLQGQIKLPI